MAIEITFAFADVMSMVQSLIFPMVLTRKIRQNLIISAEMGDDFLEPCPGICHRCSFAALSRNDHSSKLSIFIIRTIEVLKAERVELQDVRWTVLVCVYAEPNGFQRVIQQTGEYRILCLSISGGPVAFAGSHRIPANRVPYQHRDVCLELRI